MRKFLPLILFLSFFNCESFLEEEVFTQYDPEAFLADPSGIDALVIGTYSRFISTGFQEVNDFVLTQLCTDETWETGGGLNRLVLPIIEFNWDATNGYFSAFWNKQYRAISEANNVLNILEGLDGLDDATRAQLEGEIRFIRGTSYYTLHDFFGPTPIISIPPDASLDEIEAIGLETPRATEEEYRTFVETDLRAAVDNLSYGGVSSRANRGVALAFLTKFYLDNKQWDDAAESAGRLIDEGGYTLYDDVVELFSIQGENNNEFIFRYECQTGTPQVNVYMPHAFPPNFPIQSNWENFGAQFRTYTAFYETYGEEDLRRDQFVTEYIRTNNNMLQRLDRDEMGNALDNVRSFKYVPDPDAMARNNGNDIPVVRLPEIMLARAEALNELNGPTQEAIDLINLVRARSQANAIELGDFTNTEDLRDYILAERGREFTIERIRRTDLIRHGKFIERALERGKGAQEFHVLYPIPQAQLDNNPNLRQNPGY